MTIQFNLDIFNQLSEGFQGEKIHGIFKTLMLDLTDYLKLQPIYKNIEVRILKSGISEKELSSHILDSGAKRTVFDNSILIEILSNNKFLPFVLLREAYYCFVPEEIKDSIP